MLFPPRNANSKQLMIYKFLLNNCYAFPVFLIFLFFVFPVVGEKDQKDQEDLPTIIRKIDRLFRSDSSEARLTMTIVTPNWERTLTMQAWSRGMEDNG